MHSCLGLLQTQHAIRQSHVSFGDRHLANSHQYLGYRCQNALVRASANAFFLWGAPCVPNYKKQELTWYHNNINVSSYNPKRSDQWRINK